MGNPIIRMQMEPYEIEKLRVDMKERGRKFPVKSLQVRVFSMEKYLQDYLLHEIRKMALPPLYKGSIQLRIEPWQVKRMNIIKMGMFERGCTRREVSSSSIARILTRVYIEKELAGF